MRPFDLGPVTVRDLLMKNRGDLKKKDVTFRSGLLQIVNREVSDRGGCLTEATSIGKGFKFNVSRAQTTSVERLLSSKSATYETKQMSGDVDQILVFYPKIGNTLYKIRRERARKMMLWSFIAVLGVALVLNAFSSWSVAAYF